MVNKRHKVTVKHVFENMYELSVGTMTSPMLVWSLTLVDVNWLNEGHRKIGCPPTHSCFSDIQR